MSARHRPDRRTLLRYAGLQLPGLGFALIAGVVAREWLGMPSHWLWIGLALWVTKDVAMFPFVWRAYTSGSGEEARPLVGREAIAQERLDPQGYVRIGSELWRARSVGDPIDAQTRVRVLAREGFTLSVTPLEGDGSPLDA